MIYMLREKLGHDRSILARDRPAIEDKLPFLYHWMRCVLLNWYLSAYFNTSNNKNLIFAILKEVGVQVLASFMNLY